MKDEIKLLSDEEWYNHLYYPDRILKPIEVPAVEEKPQEKKKKAKKDEVSAE